MRIDLTPSTTPQLDRSGGSAAAAPATSSTIEPTASGAADEARLSTGSDAVQQLKVHLDSVPEVRQQRVNDLRQAMANGTFQISPGRIADTMLAETSRAAG